MAKQDLFPDGQPITIPSPSTKRTTGEAQPANAPFQQSGAPASPPPADDRERLNADRAGRERADREGLKKSAADDLDGHSNPYNDYMQRVVRDARENARRNHELVDADRERYLEEIDKAPGFLDEKEPRAPMSPEDAATKVGAQAPAGPSLLDRAARGLASFFGAKKGGAR